MGPVHRPSCRRASLIAHTVKSAEIRDAPAAPVSSTDYLHEWREMGCDYQLSAIIGGSLKPACSYRLWLLPRPTDGGVFLAMDVG